MVWEKKHGLQLQNNLYIMFSRIANQNISSCSNFSFAIWLMFSHSNKTFEILCLVFPISNCPKPKKKNSHLQKINFYRQWFYLLDIQNKHIEGSAESYFLYQQRNSKGKFTSLVSNITGSVLSSIYVDRSDTIKKF